MYEHYIALDWSKSNKIKVIESPSDLSGVKEYLKGLKGQKIFTIEETTSAQWLYSELKPFVTKLIVCDPHRNRLLSEGAKNDRIDATKLVHLLKVNMVKKVYHSGGGEVIDLRKLVSGYEDLVKSAVRLKNQRSALFCSEGLDHKRDTFSTRALSGHFVLQEIEEQIKLNESIKCVNIPRNKVIEEQIKLNESIKRRYERDV